MAFFGFLQPHVQLFFAVAPAFLRGPMRGRAIFTFLIPIAYMKSKKNPMRRDDPSFSIL